MKANQSFESTGQNKAKQGVKPIYDLDKLGERYIIMASDETWALWQNVFSAHQSGGLFDIDANMPFNEIMTKDGNPRPYKFAPLSSNMMKSLQGLDDPAVGELANKILDVPPKVYIHKKPTKWANVLPWATWCMNKKQKRVLVRDLADRGREVGIMEADDVYKTAEVMDPAGWKVYKEKLCLTGLHMWHLLSLDQTYFKSEISQGKKKEAPQPKLLAGLRRAMNNSERYEYVKDCSRATVCRWLRDRASFDSTLCLHKRSSWLVGVPDDIPAQLKYCEVGIMDFRFFPKVDKMEINSSNRKIVEEVEKVSGGAMSKWVHTWMIVYDGSRAIAVDELTKALFPCHINRRDLNYEYAKGEPAEKVRSTDQVMFLQRSQRTFSNSALVNSKDTIGRLSEEGHDDLVNDHAYYAKTETCRHDNKNLSSPMELRYEVYLRFIDKFCRDQGTVMLVFAGAKAISACTVITEPS